MEYQERTIKTFVSYSREDGNLLKSLLQHLSPLKRHLGLEAWTDRDLVPGERWDDKIRQQLESADLILLLVSAAFLDSEFCYENEMQRALQRHSQGTARLIPIILRPCFWRLSPFAELQVLPKSGEPITQWDDLDKAMTDVVEGIERTLTISPSSSDVRPATSPPDLTHLMSSWPGESKSATARSELLTRDLETAYSQRDSLIEAGADTSAMEAHIRDLKHQLRGPQLPPGHFFSDGRFQLIHQIGQGGFATVWLAQDRTTDTKVAVKVLHGQFSTSEERRERLFRGARQMAKLDHPHIVEVLTEPKVEDGWAYFVMEYLEGGDFRRAVLDGRLDVEQRLDVLERVALAIDHAHGKKVVHRDIKPANILLDAAGSPKLTDFDLVLAEDSTGLTRTKAGMGSYHYAAPESMDDAAGATASCDVYSLAATLVFALQGCELSSLFLIQREAYLSKLGVTEGVLEVLRRGLHWHAGKRHGTTVELVRSLRLGMASTPESTPEVASLKTDETPKTERRGSRSRPVSTDDLFRTVETCDGAVPLWCEIPSGEGWIGSPEDEEGRFNQEGPRHGIELVRPFWMAAVPVTNAQYAFFDKGKANLDRPSHPVVNVSWNDALKFCQWLEKEQGLQGARLPTEEEWEYACRAGSSTRYWSGDSVEDLDHVGWFKYNSGGATHPVGEKPANPWGLYDMHGNVWEWTASQWNEDYSRQVNGLTIDPRQVPTDLAEPLPRAQRVFRGGSCLISARNARSAYRYRWLSWVRFRLRFRLQGFRVLLPFSS